MKVENFALKCPFPICIECTMATGHIATIKWYLAFLLLEDYHTVILMIFEINVILTRFVL